MVNIKTYRCTDIEYHQQAGPPKGGWKNHRNDAQDEAENSDMKPTRDGWNGVGKAERDDKGVREDNSRRGNIVL